MVWDFPVAFRRCNQCNTTLNREQFLAHTCRNKVKVEVTINEPLNEAVAEFVRLKEQAKEIEKQMKQARIPIEEALAIGGTSIKVDKYLCSLVDKEREVFNLKEAKKHLDKQILSPYLSISRYNELQIKGVKE